MAISVAKTVYETKAYKPLAAIDVYGEPEKGDGPINNETKIPEALANGTLDIFSPKGTAQLKDKIFKDVGKSLEKALSEIGEFVKNPKDFRDALSKEILGDTLKSIGYTGTLDEAVQAIKKPINFRDVLGGMGDANPALKVIIGDVEKMIDGKDLHTATGIAALLSGLTGNDGLMQVLAVSPKVSVVKGFIDMAMELNLPGAIDELIKTVDDKEEQRQLKLHSTDNAAYHTSLDFLLGQIEDTDIGAGAIVSLYPDINTTTLENYKIKGETPTPEETVLLLNVLNKIDPFWMSYNRNGTPINDLSTLATASDDAIRVLMLDERTYAAALLVKQLKTDDMVTATLNMRPYTPPSVLTV